MTLTEAVKGTYATIGQAMTDLELALVVSDLSEYPPNAVMTALTRCRRELKRITPSDIIDRIPGGHPGPEEAWALVAKSLANEAVSIVWTNEMREAMGVALALGDDPIAARVAFKETYTRLVSEARARRSGPVWSASLGWEASGREVAKQEAENRNRATQGLPALPVVERALLDDAEVGALARSLVKGMNRAS